MRVTVIATGFDQAQPRAAGAEPAPRARPGRDREVTDGRPPALLARDPRRRDRHPVVPQGPLSRRRPRARRLPPPSVQRANPGSRSSVSTCVRPIDRTGRGGAIASPLGRGLRGGDRRCASRCLRAPRRRLPAAADAQPTLAAADRSWRPRSRHPSHSAGWPSPATARGASSTSRRSPGSRTCSSHGWSAGASGSPTRSTPRCRRRFAAGHRGQQRRAADDRLRLGRRALRRRPQLDGGALHRPDPARGRGLEPGAPDDHLRQGVPRLHGRRCRWS